MNAIARRTLWAALLAATLGTGCLHHHRSARPTTSGVLACAVRPGETSCVESSRFDEGGVLRHHVVERTTPGDGCDLVVVEQASFDERGTLVQRVIEDRRCAVVDRRISTRYDVDTGVVEHRVERDEDHDDQMDYQRVARVAMTRQVRALAVSTGQARTAHLAASIAAQRPGAAGVVREPTFMAVTGP